MNGSFANASGFGLLSTQKPEAWDSLVAMVDTVWQQQSEDAGTMELCRLRIAGLLGATEFARIRSAAAVGLSEEKALAVARYPSSELFTATERAWLAYSEQLLMDATGIDDATRVAVLTASGDAGLVRLTVAVGLFEGLARASLLLGFRAPDNPRVTSLAALAN